MGIEIKFVAMLAITSMVGSTVRVFHELEKKSMNWRQIIFIYICSFALSFVIYELSKITEWKKWSSIASLIGGIISIDIIQLFITKGAGWFEKYITSKLPKNNNEKTEENGV